MASLEPFTHNQYEAEPVSKLAVTANIFTSPLTYLSQYIRALLVKILRQGPIPKHIGFIMDGNRRFARKMNRLAMEGHYMGYNTMHEVLDICLHLGVKVVTVYAFSIENFKRPKEEVDTLMELARTKMVELCERSELVKKHGISIRVLGNMSYLSPDLREVMEKAVETTKGNIGPVLNVCFPYTSRDELTTSVKTVVKMVENEQLRIKDIDENLLEQNLFTQGSPPLEILIRTSGEIRLSDFLLWQCHQNCYVYFVDCYWPEFSFWEMLPIILDYQINFESIKDKRKKSRHHLSKLYNNAD